MRLLPFHRTFELVMKLLPFTVRVKAAAPAAVLDGFSPAMLGTGLLERPPHEMVAAMRASIKNMRSRLMILQVCSSWSTQPAGRDRELELPF